MSDADILASNLGSTGYYGLRVETETDAQYELVNHYMPAGAIVSETISPFEVESTSVFYGIEGIFHFQLIENEDSTTNSDNDTKAPVAPEHVIIATSYPKISGQQVFNAWAGDDELPVDIDEEGFDEFLTDAATFKVQKDAVLRCGAAAWTVVRFEATCVVRLWLGDFPRFIRDRFSEATKGYPHRDYDWRPIEYTFHDSHCHYLSRRMEIMREKVQTPYADEKMRDLFLFRYLQSALEKIDRAVSMADAYMDWYELEDVEAKRERIMDGLAGAPYWDILTEEWQGSFYEIYDEATNTQYIVDSPSFQSIIDGKIDYDQLLECWIHHMEYRMLQMQKRSVQTGQMTFTTWIMRLYNHESATSLTVLNALRRLAMSTAHLYVHHMRQIIILDVPVTFSNIVNTAAAWVPESVNRKLQIYPIGTDVDPIIERVARGEDVKEAIRKVLRDLSETSGNKSSEDAEAA
eukprot:GEMP01025199.1.p1 GENE.GEMP01025199.1~~GEMP01025199.1.p1  ORF type:complete len:463 (-),score=72.73 GEMP01025199.1:917-2305(-)